MRAISFGAGDYAFNLYWQTVTLYLLFFYTDRLGLTPDKAGIIMVVGAFADGLADLAIGLAADRWRLRYRKIVAWGAVPLAILFMLLFVQPALSGPRLFALILTVHMAFRILYALVNLPYAAWSVRVSHHVTDRTLMSGSRMTFGALGAVTVAFAMPTGGESYGGMAIWLGLVATCVLGVVVWRVPEDMPGDRPQAMKRTIRKDLHALYRNRPFLMLGAATLCVTIAGAIIGHSVLYYFTYVLSAPPAGKQALAVMGVTGAVAVPVWTAVAMLIGARASWLIAAALGMIALAGFALWPVADIFLAIVTLALVQSAMSGFHLAAWAMLPNAVDHDESVTGFRVETTAFSLFMLIQKIGLGLAALLLGLAYTHWGYKGGTPDAAGRAVIHWLMIAGPLAAIAAGAAIMALSPLRGRAGQASTNMSDTPSA
jgi:GPH family glycoside/pentoside/hexuronide:cation symporter